MGFTSNLGANMVEGRRWTANGKDIKLIDFYLL